MSYFYEEARETADEVIACKTRSHVTAARLLALYVVERATKLEEIADGVREIFDAEPDVNTPDGLAQIRIYESFLKLKSAVDSLG